MKNKYDIFSINNILVIEKQIACIEFNNCKIKSKFKCLICGFEFEELNSVVIHRDYLCRKCNRIKREKLQLEKANNDLIKHNLVCIDYAGTMEKRSKTLCLTCGNIITKPLSNFKETDYACYYCSKLKIKNNGLIKNYDKIYSIIKNKEDGNNYYISDKDYIEFICPSCNATSKKKISNVYSNGFKCEYCSDNISFPNKIMRSILDTLTIDYISEANFNWAINKRTNKRYRYDFYIENKNCIIEMMGLHHGEDIPNWKLSLEEVQYRDEDKKRLAIKNGISTYIEIDSYVSDIDYIFNNILNSELSSILNLNLIKKEEIGKLSANSIAVECWKVWNSHPEYTTTDMCKIFKLERHAIIDYLKAGHKIGCCKYDVEIENGKRTAKSIRTRYGVLNVYDENNKFLKSYTGVPAFCKEMNCPPYPIYRDLRKYGIAYFNDYILRREV